MERSYFYDSTDTDQRIYQAADFARFYAQIIGNGVSNTQNLPDLSVEIKQNMTVQLGAGYAFANGSMYENTAALDLIHDVAEPTMDRIDRIVIRFDNDPVQRRNYAYIKKGIASANPVPPDLQRDDYVFEMSVAQVRIIAGKSFIEQSQISDERANDAICGYIPLHNIYRGLSIDELGIVSMPNQSYVEIYNQNPITLPANQDTTLNLGAPVFDLQNEINGNTFTPKADGVYGIYVLLSFNGSVPSTTDLQASALISGVDRIFLFAKPGMGGSDNNFMGMAFKYLHKGDTMQLKVNTLGATASLTTTYFRVSIAKIS